MAAPIVSQPASSLEEHSSFAELSVVYGDKAVAEAQSRLRIVLQFKSLQPKTVRLGSCRVLSPAVDQLAERAT